MRSIVIVLAIFSMLSANAQFPNTAGTPTEQEAVGQAQEYWRKITETILGNARRLVTPTLSARDRQIESQINYRVTASPNINAIAYIDGGRRFVRLRSMSTQFFGWIAAAEVMGGETDNENCFIGYMQYFGKNFIHNSKVATSGGTFALTFEPTLAVERGLVPMCNADIETYRKVVTQKWSYISRQGEAAVMLLWLHEVAHHVLGHVDNPSASLAMRRQQESEADEWAIRAMTNANQFASVGRPFFYMVSVFQGMSLAEEQQSTHPLGARRARSIFAAIAPAVRANPQLMASLRKEPDLETQYFDDLTGLQNQATAMIPTK